MSRQRGEESLPEAVPLLSAHVDEELLTRKKYFEENLRKQIDEIEKTYTIKERSLRDSFSQKAKDAQAQYVSNKANFDAQLVTKREHEDRKRERKEEEAKLELKDNQRARADQVAVLRKENARKEEARQLAEWIVYNPQEGKAFEAEEERKRQETLMSLRDETDREKQRLLHAHLDKMSEIAKSASTKSERWQTMKPVLICAMLGGAAGLILTPSL